MKRITFHAALLAGALISAAFAAACSKSDHGAASEDAALAGCGSEVPGASPEVPDDLRCTGLYRDFDAKTVASAARAYTPASPLWSDGAEKHRWIQLPEGATIDATSMDDWSFPVGTKAWKEFVVDGRRVETRFLWKVRGDRWLQASYVWSADGKTATRGEGAKVDLGGRTWNVPGATDCNSCHDGRKDKLLGFEAVNLALPGADGVTLATLVSEQRIQPAPAKTSITIPDDGTGKAAPALAWMHTNCGVSCHSKSDDAIGGRVGLHLRLGWDELTGARPPAEWDALRTTIGVEAKSGDWAGRPRIAPGDPEASLVPELVETRGPGQMPKLGTDVVDETGADAIRAWISAMGKAPGASPGAPADPSTDPGTTTTPTPAGSTCLDTSVAETEANDTPQTANTMPGATGTFCGTIASATDVDVVTFTAPTDFKGLSLKLATSGAGAVVTVSVNGGAPVTLAQGTPVPAVFGGVYVVEISGPANLAYRLALTLK